MSRCKKYSKLRHVPRLIYPAEDSMHETWGWFSEFPRYSPHTHSLMNLIARADPRVYDSWSTLSKDRTPLAIQSQTTKTCDTLFVWNSNLKRHDSHAPIFSWKIFARIQFSQRRVWEKKKKNRKDFVCKETDAWTDVDPSMGCFACNDLTGSVGDF